MRSFRLAHILVLLALASGLAEAQDTRLSNLAIRAQGGAGAEIITGFTVGPGSNKTILIRAVGPTLGAFGVEGALADPKLELFSNETKVAENDNWRDTDAAQFNTVGAFPLSDNSKDAAIITTLAPGSYTAQVTGVGNTAGVTLVEVYELAGGTARLVNLSTRSHVGTGGGILIPGITIAPGSGSRRLLIRAVGPTLSAFGVSGALSDPKLELFSGTLKVAENDNWSTAIGSGSADAATLTAASAQSGAFALPAGSKDAALLINLPAGSYTLQVSGAASATGTALVEIYDLTPANQASAGTLYLAPLRPAPNATNSVASGYATILVNPDGTAFVNVAFSNLSSDQTSAHLQLGSSGDYVLNLQRGQVSNALWAFSPVGPHQTADLIAALNTGNLSVSVDSARYPGGELRGNFVPMAGSQNFAAPAAPPSVPASSLTNPTQAEAARFLLQATFGPTTASIASLMTRGIPGWIDDQMALPATSGHAGLMADVAEFPNPPVLVPTMEYAFEMPHNWHAAWWKIAVTAPDQLRQRVAFALSEILVVGSQSDIDFNIEAKTVFYDYLVNGAFGNFRDLLEKASVSPVMGFWLSHWANQKADPAKGTVPDENYARELMQLFTIGLVQLQPDGTLMLDRTGQPIPTYDQTTVAETAKVLTGWAFARYDATTTNVGQFRAYPATATPVTGVDPTNPWLHPMRHFNAFHDKTEKRIVSLEQVPIADARPTLVPANQSGPADLKVLLDTLFNHPNTGPFISRRLIQRLVTSNPSPGYIYRVAQVFANDGTGSRGNLGAVVRAILTDYEARSPALVGNAGHGKIKEPLIRLTGLLRALNGSAPNGRFMDSYFRDPRTGTYYPAGFMNWPIGQFGQMVLQSPTVFNFFSADYSPPGPLAAAGLVAPELEITDANFAISVPNSLHNLITRNLDSLPLPPTGASPFLRLDLSPLLPLARNPTGLIDQLSLLFCGGQMTTTTRTQIVTMLQGLPAGFTDLQRVQNALHVVVSSPDAVTQK